MNLAGELHDLKFGCRTSTSTPRIHTWRIEEIESMSRQARPQHGIGSSTRRGWLDLAVPLGSIIRAAPHRTQIGKTMSVQAECIDIEMRKRELRQLQSEIETQYLSLKSQLSEAFDRVQEARIALYAEKAQALAEIANFISDRFGIRVDTEDDIRSMLN
jgi:hypothetical protein